MQQDAVRLVPSGAGGNRFKGDRKNDGPGARAALAAHFL